MLNGFVKGKDLIKQAVEFRGWPGCVCGKGVGDHSPYSQKF